MPEMKVPGPDHPITMAPSAARLRVRFAGHVVDSARALMLKEAGYQAAAYFPREDVSMEYLTRTDRVTHCPYKGEAHYYTLEMDGRIAENAVWTYEAPYPSMRAIGGYLAFYPNLVEVYAFGVANDPDAVREAIEHTDDGAGRSQREHWPPSAEAPKEPGA